MSQHHQPNRRSIRLRGYDYAQAGMYFVTICAWQRACRFGAIVDGAMRLHEDGRIVGEEWERTAAVRPSVSLDAWVVMPNHFHGILIIGGRGTPAACPYEPAISRRFGQPVSGSLSTIIGQFKSMVTKRINARRGTPGAPVWQRNYYEHIIRNEADLARIREYIVHNPLRWELDQLHPDNPSQW